MNASPPAFRTWRCPPRRTAPTEGNEGNEAKGDPAVLAWDLGAGEPAVLNWAFRERDFEAILDDRAGRKCAWIHHIPFRGTIGIILAARTQGLVPAARPLLDQLVKAGLLVDGRVLRGALISWASEERAAGADVPRLVSAYPQEDDV